MSKLLTTTALCMALGLGVASAQQQPQTPPTQQQTPGATSPTQGGDRFMTKQQSSEVSAEDMIGAAVYDTSNNKIGEVNDLIMDNQGKVQAAVIGVGGFLGMGEKDVAVKFNELQSQAQQGGEIRVTLNATRDQLQSAPEYAYMREQRDDQPATGAVPGTDRNMPNTPDNTPMTPPSQNQR